MSMRFGPSAAFVLRRRAYLCRLTAVHRVWSTDWFRLSTAEVGRVIMAIEATKAELAAGGERERQRQSVNLEVVAVDR